MSALNANPPDALSRLSWNGSLKLLSISATHWWTSPSAATQGTPHETGRFQFAHDEAGLQCLTEAYLVGEEIPNPIAGNGAEKRMKLVRQRNAVRL